VSELHQFLTDSLGTLRFPPPVAPEVVAIYGSRDPLILARNKHLASSLRALVTPDSTPMLQMELALSSLAGLDIVLSLDDIASSVLQDILTFWHLSPEDQLRALDRDLDDEALEYMTFDIYLNKDSKALLAERYGLRLKWSTEREEAYGWDVAVSTPRDDETMPYVPAEYTRRGLWLRVSDLDKFYDLSFLSDDLIARLGDGHSEHSLSAWRNYLDLLNSPPDVPLCNIVDAARRLAPA
jgi:hypothetical protein